MYSGGELGIRMHSEGGSLICTSVLFGPPTPSEDVVFIFVLYIDPSWASGS